MNNEANEAKCGCDFGFQELFPTLKLRTDRMGMGINSPIPQDFKSECDKCAKIIRKFVTPDRDSLKGKEQDIIPPDIIAKCEGVAILTVVKAGFIWSGRAGSGLVVAKLEGGKWSAPSAIGTAGMGFGGQIGAEVTDFVIVLNSKDAVKAFSKGGNVTLGGNLSVSAGPYGRTGEVAGAVRNLAPIYSYSKSKGLFAGVSIEGSVILERKDTNTQFYGNAISAKKILSGEIEAPAAADPLYRALNDHMKLQHSSDTINSAHLTNTGVGGMVAAPSYKSQSAYPSTDRNFSSASKPHDLEPPRYETRYENTNQYYVQEDKKSGWQKPEKQNQEARRGSSSLNRGPPPPLPPNKPKRMATALYDYDAEVATDLSFKAGDSIAIIAMSQSTDDWWKGSCKGKTGQFPANYVELR
jgi:lipid-binding SYLF domain-containing protein